VRGFLESAVYLILGRSRFACKRDRGRIGFLVDRYLRDVDKILESPPHQRRAALAAGMLDLEGDRRQGFDSR